jgi:hypothetical protein
MNNDKDYMNMTDSQEYSEMDNIFNNEDPNTEYTNRLFKQGLTHSKSNLDSKVTKDKSTAIKSELNADKELLKHTEQIINRDHVSYSIAFGRAQEEHPELAIKFSEENL